MDRRAPAAAGAEPRAAGQASIVVPAPPGQASRTQQPVVPVAQPKFEIRLIHQSYPTEIYAAKNLAPNKTYRHTFMLELVPTAAAGKPLFNVERVSKEDLTRLLSIRVRFEDGVTTPHERENSTGLNAREIPIGQPSFHVDELGWKSSCPYFDGTKFVAVVHVPFNESTKKPNFVPLSYHHMERRFRLGFSLKDPMAWSNKTAINAKVGAGAHASSSPSASSSAYATSAPAQHIEWTDPLWVKEIVKGAENIEIYDKKLKDAAYRGQGIPLAATQPVKQLDPITSAVVDRLALLHRQDKGGKHADVLDERGVSNSAYVHPSSKMEFGPSLLPLVKPFDPSSNEETLQSSQIYYRLFREGRPMKDENGHQSSAAHAPFELYLPDQYKSQLEYFVDHPQELQDRMSVSIVRYDFDRLFVYVSAEEKIKPRGKWIRIPTVLPDRLNEDSVVPFRVTNINPEDGRIVVIMDADNIPVTLKNRNRPNRLVFVLALGVESAAAAEGAIAMAAHDQTGTAQAEGAAAAMAGEAIDLTGDGDADGTAPSAVHAGRRKRARENDHETANIDAVSAAAASSSAAAPVIVDDADNNDGARGSGAAGASGAIVAESSATDVALACAGAEAAPETKVAPAIDIHTSRLLVAYTQPLSIESKAPQGTANYRDYRYDADARGVRYSKVPAIFSRGVTADVSSAAAAADASMHLIDEAVGLPRFAASADAGAGSSSSASDSYGSGLTFIRVSSARAAAAAALAERGEPITSIPGETTGQDADLGAVASKKPAAKKARKAAAEPATAAARQSHQPHMVAIDAEELDDVEGAVMFVAETASGQGAMSGNTDPISASSSITSSVSRAGSAGSSKSKAVLNRGKPLTMIAATAPSADAAWKQMGKQRRVNQMKQFASRSAASLLVKASVAGSVDDAGKGEDSDDPVNHYPAESVSSTDNDGGTARVDGGGVPVQHGRRARAAPRRVEGGYFEATMDEHDVYGFTNDTRHASSASSSSSRSLNAAAAADRASSSLSYAETAVPAARGGRSRGAAGSGSGPPSRFTSIRSAAASSPATAAMAHEFPVRAAGVRVKHVPRGRADFVTTDSTIPDARQGDDYDGAGMRGGAPSGGGGVLVPTSADQRYLPQHYHYSQHGHSVGGQYPAGYLHQQQHLHPIQPRGQQYGYQAAAASASGGRGGHQVGHAAAHPTMQRGGPPAHSMYAHQEQQQMLASGYAAPYGHHHHQSRMQVQAGWNGDSGPSTHLYQQPPQQDQDQGQGQYFEGTGEEYIGSEQQYAANDDGAAGDDGTAGYDDDGAAAQDAAPGGDEGDRYGAAGYDDEYQQQQGEGYADDYEDAGEEGAAAFHGYAAAAAGDGGDDANYHGQGHEAYQRHSGQLYTGHGQYNDAPPYNQHAQTHQLYQPVSVDDQYQAADVGADGNVFNNLPAPPAVPMPAGYQSLSMPFTMEAEGDGGGGYGSSGTATGQLPDSLGEGFQSQDFESGSTQNGSQNHVQAWDAPAYDAPQPTAAPTRGWRSAASQHRSVEVQRQQLQQQQRQQLVGSASAAGGSSARGIFNAGSVPVRTMGRGPVSAPAVMAMASSGSSHAAPRQALPAHMMQQQQQYPYHQQQVHMTYASAPVGPLSAPAVMQAGPGPRTMMVASSGPNARIISVPRQQLHPAQMHPHGPGAGSGQVMPPPSSRIVGPQSAPGRLMGPQQQLPRSVHHPGKMMVHGPALPSSSSSHQGQAMHMGAAPQQQMLQARGGGPNAMLGLSSSAGHASHVLYGTSAAAAAAGHHYHRRDDAPIRIPASGSESSRSPESQGSTDSHNADEANLLMSMNAVEVDSEAAPAAGAASSPAV